MTIWNTQKLNISKRVCTSSRTYLIFIISVVPVLLTQIQEFPNSDIFTIPSRQNLGNPQATVAASSTVHQRGLCRDGWSRGSIIDVSGEEIPVCMRLNPQAQTWSEAQDTCRKDYGFLLKLDSPAKINNVNLVSYLSEQGKECKLCGVLTLSPPQSH